MYTKGASNDNLFMTVVNVERYQAVQQLGVFSYMMMIMVMIRGICLLWKLVSKLLLAEEQV